MGARSAGEEVGSVVSRRWHGKKGPPKFFVFVFVFVCLISVSVMVGSLGYLDPEQARSCYVRG